MPACTLLGRAGRYFQHNELQAQLGHSLDSDILGCAKELAQMMLTNLQRLGVGAVVDTFQHFSEVKQMLCNSDVPGSTSFDCLADERAQQSHGLLGKHAVDCEGDFF